MIRCFNHSLFFLSRVSGSNIIGHDIDGDGRPDIPLNYNIEDKTEVEFPLNFCPGVRFDWTEGEGSNKIKKRQWHITPDAVLYPCQGYWGVAIKQWETIKQVIEFPYFTILKFIYFRRTL